MLYRLDLRAEKDASFGRSILFAMLVRFPPPHKALVVICCEYTEAMKKNRLPVTSVLWVDLYVFTKVPSKACGRTHLCPPFIQDFYSPVHPQWLFLFQSWQYLQGGGHVCRMETCTAWLKISIKMVFTPPTLPAAVLPASISSWRTEHRLRCRGRALIIYSGNKRLRFWNILKDHLYRHRTPVVWIHRSPLKELMLQVSNLFFPPLWCFATSLLQLLSVHGSFYVVFRFQQVKCMLDWVRTGDWLSHCRTFNFFALKNSWVPWTECFGSLPICKVKPSPTNVT